MKKFFGVFFLTAALLAAALPAASPLDLQDATMELFTATITLLDMETREGSVFLSLGLPGGGTEEAMAWQDCRFLDERGNSLSPSDFLERYKEKTITIDFVESTPDLYTVFECRAGNK